ncbi:MAG: TlpA disulfide reductase family protein [Sulfurimicrobium sp.]|jgi:thiol-disulfide isomerase/thioredoxin|nr:TlpA disulfide reductase family protein [Sulfurimicrobium sp.]
MKKLLLGLCCLFFLTAAQASELKPWKGGSTPPLALQDLKGKTHKLEDYRGKVVMVQFWATWCPPCLKEMPAMQRLDQKMAGKPFVILAVNMGETGKDVSDFVNKMKINFNVLMDEEGNGVGAWKVFVAPSTFLVDPQGNIRYTLQGGAEWDEPEYVKVITGLMPAK